MKYKESLKELGFSRLWKRRLERGGTDCIFYFLEGLVVKMEPDSSEMHSKRTSHNGNRLQKG